jgi:hypothetical protein
MVPADPDDEHPYYIKRLKHRMKRRDFKLLPLNVQRNYHVKLQQHQEMYVKEKQEAEKAKAGFIPSGGMMVSCDFYVPGVNGKEPKRLRVPSEALSWLMDKLKSQGFVEEELNQMDLASQAEIGQMGQLSQLGNGGQMAPGRAPMPPMSSLSA